MWRYKITAHLLLACHMHICNAHFDTVKNVNGIKCKTGLAILSSKLMWI